MILPLRNLCRTTIRLLLLGTLAPAGAAGQVVPLRTVPLPAGEQFLVVPTRTLGMGSASIALDDPWQDPFVNPAKGARIEGLRIFALPTFYRADGSGGGGATLPAAFLARGGRFFGGGGLAYQAPDDPNATFYNAGWPAAIVQSPADLGPPTNAYAYGVVGWTLADRRTSLGVGVAGAQLEMITGVDRLYGNRTWLQEHGRTRDYRLGVLRELGGGSSVEALLLNSRIDMNYDVGRITWWFDNRTPYPNNTRTWTDHNIDRSSTWGLQLRYVGLQDTAGYRPAASFVVNRKTYPSLPNYDIAPVPRDPGDSWAFSAGVGTTHVHGRHTIVLEAALEPGWAHTWAVTPQHPDGTATGIVPGARTSENWFRFLNGHALFGLEQRRDWGAWQVGLRLDEVHYSMERQNYETGAHVNSSDGWVEWSPTWGIALPLGRAELRYAGHLVTNDFPDFGETKTVVTPPAPAPGGGPDFLPPAVGSSSRNFWSAAHQLTLSLPLGRAGTETRR